MSKAGMKRPHPEVVTSHKDPYRKNDVKPVEELQGKAKHTKERANKT